MSEQNFASRYTDSDYLSKRQLKSIMRIASVDGFWKEIEDYRAASSLSLAPFCTINNRPFRLTLTQETKRRIDEAYSRLEQFTMRLNENQGSRFEIAARKLLFQSCSALMEAEGLHFNDVAIKAMAANMYVGDEPGSEVLRNYIGAVRDLSDRDASQFALDTDELAFYYQTMLGGVELVSFYRTTDSDTLRMGGLGYIYDDGAPAAEIEGLVDKMYEGLIPAAVSPFAKAVLAAFYFDAIKPFDRHVKEVGVLLGLSILAKSGLGPSAFYLPLAEMLRNTGAKRYGLASSESQKTGDATYVVLYAAEVITKAVNGILREFDKLTPTSLVYEFNRLDENEVKQAQERGVYQEPRQDYRQKEEEAAPIEETKIQEPAYEPLFEPIEELEPEPKAEVPTPMIEVEEPKPVTKPAAKHRPYEEVPSEAAIDRKSLASAQEALNEKEAKEYAKYLIETNPELSKGQAKFYSTHCTMGRYYVIQQYKKYCRCAYETARTSMDKLAELGFYKKMSYKNKFVYTPIKQGE